MDGCGWWQIQEPRFYHDRIFKLVPRVVKCGTVLGDYVENNDTSME
jgi:hypothetical protein